MSMVFFNKNIYHKVSKEIICTNNRAKARNPIEIIIIGLSQIVYKVYF